LNALLCDIEFPRHRIPNSGQPVQLIQPLDFLVVTDHGEFIRMAPMIHESHPELLADSW